MSGNQRERPLCFLELDLAGATTQSFSKKLQMTLRPATLSDKAALYSLHVELFREHIEKIWGWDDEWQTANFQKEWEEVATEIIHAGDELLGYIQTRLESDHLYVLNLAMNPRHQNQGWGTAAMNILKKRARTERLPMRLSVFRTNPRVIHLYERLGFEIYATTETGCKMCWMPPPLTENQSGEQVVAPNRSLPPTLNSTSPVRGSED